MQLDVASLQRRYQAQQRNAKRPATKGRQGDALYHDRAVVVDLINKWAKEAPGPISALDVADWLNAEAVSECGVVGGWTERRVLNVVSYAKRYHMPVAQLHNPWPKPSLSAAERVRKLDREIKKLESHERHHEHQLAYVRDQLSRYREMRAKAVQRLCKA